MQNLVIFALLMVGCMGSDDYDRYDASEDPDKEFNWFVSNDPLPPLSNPEELTPPLVFSFFANRKGENGLAFTNENALLVFRFGEEEQQLRENFKLNSITFKFPRGRPCQVNLRFKSMATQKDITVMSRVFTPPEDTDEASKDHANRKATFANTMNLEATQPLLDRTYPFHRVIDLDIQWVVEVLQRAQPHLYSWEEPNEWKQFYVALPVIVHGRVLRRLNKVRRDMQCATEEEEEDGFLPVLPNCRT